MTTCLECRRWDDADTHLCHPCTSHCRVNLAGLARNYIKSNDPARTPRGEATAGPRAAHALPGGTSRLSWRRDVTSTLGWWTRLWADILHRTGPDATDVRTLTKWLANNLASASRNYDAIQGFARDMAHLHALSQTYVGNPPVETHPIQCPADLDPQLHNRDTCGTWLNITPKEPTRCPTCGTNWTQGSLLRLVWDNPKPGDSLPLDMAAQLARVNRTTLTRWVNQGHITRKQGRYNLASIKAHQANSTARIG